MLMRAVFVGFAGLTLVHGAMLGAQERAVPPSDVAVVADGPSAVVTWTPVPVEGVMYRVARTLDPRRTPVDITSEPVDVPKVLDGKIQSGVTYFYQVIAVYRDATTAAAALVSFTAPTAAAPPAAPLTAITEVAPVRVEMPTAVTGVTVTGNTTASALVSWQPVAGATSYSVKRSYGTVANTITGLTTTSWTDPGPHGVGFPTPGAYTYEVTAFLPFGSVSGQGGWKRPDPSCAEPPATQPALGILEPTKLISFGSRIPVGPTIIWQSGWGRAGAIALRMDRSVQGSGTWTFAGSSCDGTIPPDGKNLIISSPIKGIAPNTTYLYKLTAIAANGEIGVGTIPWTSPGASVIHWLSATSNGSTVTLNFRYEPPATNPPVAPSERFRVTAPYGLNQIVSGGGCASLTGCSLVLTGVPSGTHVFTAIAEWKDGSRVMWSLYSPATVVVP